jgi:histidine triad (HIT) family protein
MADGCVFCAIVAGTAPAERVYEDASVIAIMDIHPAATGHVLVIPKHHSPDLWHIKPAEAEKTMAASVQVAGMIRRALGPDGDQPRPRQRAGGLADGLPLSPASGASL